MCSYSNIEFGSNIHFNKQDVNDKAILTLNLAKMKKRQVFFIAKLDEVEKIFPNQLVVVPSQPLPNKSSKNKWSKPSGYIILCRAVIGRNCTTESYWHQEDLSVLNRIKNSVVGNKNTPHFGAKGKYYSFGINALYKIDEKQSLLGTYGIKSSKDPEKNKRIIESSKWMEDKLVDSLLSAITSQSQGLPNCSNFLSPTMDVGQRIQKEIGDVNLCFGKLGEIGLYAAQVCINATTRDFHTKFDQGPTLICVPNQILRDGIDYKFCFLINEETIIQLPMTMNLSFYFRQHS